MLPETSTKKHLNDRPILIGPVPMDQIMFPRSQFYTGAHNRKPFRENRILLLLNFLFERRLLTDGPTIGSIFVYIHTTIGWCPLGI